MDKTTGDYYEQKFQEHIELIDCYWLLIKWLVIAGFFVWIGTKL